MELSVKALEKLLDYTVDFLVEPLLGDWKARREVRANITQALGEARANQILAVGRAVAEVEAQKVRAVAEAPPEAAPSIDTDELDRRIQRNLERRLSNIAAIVDKARLALPAGDVPDVEPDVGWTSSFSSAAQGVSSDEMQEIWARVLAGEVMSQGRTSVRTLSILRELDQETAKLFRRLCSMSVSFSVDGVRVDHRVIALGGNGNPDSFQGYGFSYFDLNVLNEHGLAAPEYDSVHGFGACVAMRDVEEYAHLEPRAFTRVESPGWRVPLPFSYQGRDWGLVPEVTPENNKHFATFTVSGASLTRAGRELSKVVELEPVPEYDAALRDYFAKNGLRMELVSPAPPPS